MSCRSGCVAHPKKNCVTPSFIIYLGLFPSSQKPAAQHLGYHSASRDVTQLQTTARSPSRCFADGLLCLSISRYPRHLSSSAMGSFRAANAAVIPWIWISTATYLVLMAQQS